MRSNHIPLEHVCLAEGTTEVLACAFENCQSLRSVYIPDSVTRIGMNAFKGCTGLEHINFPPRLEQIELSAFCGCASLREVVLPDSLRELGDDAFANCTALRRVRLPDTLAEIGSCAFQNCKSLEEVVLPDALRELPAGVFSGCTGLRRVVLPDAMRHISPYAFYRCGQLEYVDGPYSDDWDFALMDTPFLRRRHPADEGLARLPMEFLHWISGRISGVFLSARGCAWADIDREYSFFMTKHPYVIEVRSPCDAPSGEANRAHHEAKYDYLLVDGNMEPIPGVQRRLRYSGAETQRERADWEAQIDLAASIVKQARRGL